MISLSPKIAIVFLSLCLFSCLKPVTYPNEPEIEYVSFETSSDSGKITFSFTDGDGNIGLEQEDVAPPYEPGSFYYYNLYITCYELMGGQWSVATVDPQGNNSLIADSIVFNYRIENISNAGQNKALRGEIEVILEPFYFNPYSNHSDSIRYSILLIDRSLNHSNLIYSPTIVR